MEVATEEYAQCKVEQLPRQDSKEGSQEREDNVKIERKEPREASPTDSQEANDTRDGHESEQDEQNEESEHEEQPIRKHKQAIEVKQEEKCKRGHRKKSMKEKPQRKPKSNKKKKKQTRQMKPIEKDDPRYRGVPKIKRIRKRRNKPKPISAEAKREAELKKQEEEYNKKITKRGRKPVITRLRGQKKRKQLQKARQDSQNLKLEEDKRNVKLEQSEEQYDSENSQESNDSKQRGIKRRISRKQRQKERDEDKRKVDSIMKARGQRQRREQIELMVRMQRMLAAKFGKKILIQIDPTCKYYSQYKFRKNEIEKSGKLYCQIYNKHPMPATGKHFFQVKIARLSFQSVTIGVITANNFDQLYSRDKPQCICFDAYTHSTYVQGQKTELQVEVKLNDVIRTIVDIPNSNVHWYLNNDFISQAIIPEHMTVVPLYPYMQVSNKWIKLRINQFQQ